MLLFLLSPAKKLDEVREATIKGENAPYFLERSSELIDILKTLSPQRLESLMKISDKLAILNAERYSSFSVPFTHNNAKEALYLFNGDAYEALDAYSLSVTEIDYLQKHLVMLSGLYGALHPLDLIAPYRLEMGTALQNKKGKNLYEFWGESVSEYLNQIIQKEKITTVVNLASNEYFSVINPKKLQASIVTPVFKDLKNGQYKTISFNAKKARGAMVRFAAEQKIKAVEDLKSFAENGYCFQEINHHKPTEWLFYKD